MENINENYTNLCDWISKNGGWVNPKLTIEQTEKFGRTIITQVDIEPGEDIFRLPKELQLNLTNCGLDGFNLSNTFEYRDQIVISLLYECQNPETKWKPYILLLPNLSDFENHPMVLFYHNKFPNISAEIFNRVSNLYQSFNQFWLKLQNFNTTTNLFKQMPNFTECMWAFLTVITRMWASCGLVPFADMLQHSNYSPIFLDSQGEKFSSMTSKDKITSGSPIYDNYLVQDDITLYVNFGFVEQSDRTHLSIGFQFETKNTLIATIINSERNKFQDKKIYLSTEGINHDLMAFLRLHLLDSNDLKIANFENDLFFYQLITLANELRCLQKLKTRLNFLIEQKELEFSTNNIGSFQPYSPDWCVCKLILNCDDLKNRVNSYIEEYWKSFLA
jgi:hypothetical protein